MSQTGDSSHPISPFRAGRIIFWVSLALITASVVAYVRTPHGAADVVYDALWLLLIVAITIGPIARGARPRRIWFIETMAGVCLLLSALGQFFDQRIGPVLLRDVTYILGFILLVAWVVKLFHHVVGPDAPSSLLDSAAAGVGVSLALWSVALAPHLGEGRLPVGLADAVYPVIDVVMLALVVHLTIRLGRRNAALRWLIAAISLQLALDTAHSVLELMRPDFDTTPVNALFIYWLFFLAVAATHRSVVDISRRSPGRRIKVNTRILTLVMVLAASPALLSNIVPVNGTVDPWVRSALVATLLGLLVARLRRTIMALAQSEAASRHRATHDELTGLLNRAALLDELAMLLQTDAEQGRRTAVLFLDCDHFKHVNDTWGHHAGDALLNDIAARLPSVLGSADVLARHGGDEFVVCTSVADIGEAIELAERIGRFFDNPLRILPGRSHPVTSSIGIAIAEPGEEVDTEELLAQADLAMYEAKQRARGRYVVFGEDLAQQARTRANVGDRLLCGLRSGQFRAELQPVMRGPGYTEIVGWEALARWNEPDLGEIPPAVFIPLAEQLGVITELGEFMLRTAVAEVLRLREALGDDRAGLFVNVSPAQLLDPGFADLVIEVLAESGLPKRTLRLEVTENMLIDEGPTVDGTLRAVTEAGACIVLDDFGSGYASLATLMRLPVHGVKLDKSLTARLGVDAEAPQRIGAVINLIHSLGIDAVIAEGVETAEQAAALAALGCPMVQGWHYGRPASPDKIIAELVQRRSLTEAGQAASPAAS